MTYKGVSEARVNVPSNCVVQQTAGHALRGCLIQACSRYSIFEKNTGMDSSQLKSYTDQFSSRYYPLRHFNVWHKDNVSGFS
jgi:hypothetical protein